MPTIERDWPAGLGMGLFERRIVYLRGRLDDARGAEVAAQLMTLDALGDDPIELIVDSANGTIDAALAVADTIDLLGVPVHSTCLGRAEGPAVLALAVSGLRRASPNARIRLSAPASSSDGRVDDVEAWLLQHRDRIERFVVRLALGTRQRIEKVRQDVANGRTFDAPEAIRYGIVDEILMVRSRPQCPCCNQLGGSGL